MENRAIAGEVEKLFPGVAVRSTVDRSSAGDVAGDRTRVRRQRILGAVASEWVAVCSSQHFF